MITKFDSADKPDFVTQDFLIDDRLTGQQVIGYRVYLNGDVRIADGDYIIRDDNGVIIGVITSAEYSSNLELQNIVREEVGKGLIRAIWSSLSASALSSSQKAGIASTISPVMVMIITGEIRAARFLANSTGTNANYTAGVKSALLNLMDQHIAKL